MAKDTPKLHAVDTTDDIAPVTVGNPAAAADLAIDQEHLEEFASPETMVSEVDAGKPAKSVYFTVRAENGKPWKDRAFFFVLEVEGYDPFLVSPAIAKEKMEEEEDVIRPVLIVRYVTISGDEGLWILKLNPTDGRRNLWNSSAQTILKIAEGGRWVRMVRGKKSYRHQVSPKTFKEVPPKFSERTFADLVNAAFEDRIITTTDHEIWRVLKEGK